MSTARERFDNVAEYCKECSPDRVWTHSDVVNLCNAAREALAEQDGFLLHREKTSRTVAEMLGLLSPSSDAN